MRILGLAALAGFLLLWMAPGHAQAAPVFKKDAGIPDCPTATPGSDLCRNQPKVTIEEARARLRDADIAYWVDGVRLNIVARSGASSLKLTGTIQEVMDRLPAADLWAASYTLPHMDESLLEMWTRPQALGAKELEYRGPNAPVTPKTGWNLQGRVRTLSITSRHLGEARKISVYLPVAPPPAGGYPVIYMADGESISDYAPLADDLIRRKVIQPTLIVGFWSALTTGAEPIQERRWNEYLKAADPGPYRRHEAFVLDEVMPLMEREYGAAGSARRRTIFGTSNGADWAIGMAADHPDRFGEVMAFSPGDRHPDLGKLPGVRARLEAGAYEGVFLKAARLDCDALNTAGARCRLDSYYAGHSGEIWKYEFARLLTERR